MNKKILITGSSGFIAKNLKIYLLNKHYEVESTSRFKKNKFFFDLESITNYENILPKFDILIHLAYLRHYSIHKERKHNINGSEKIFKLAKKNKAKIIYISSQSAAENSLSNYGKIKFEIEQIAEKYDAYIIKPGLIYDTRSQLGIYGYIENLVKKMPFIFVPNGLSKTINLCNIDMLIFTIVEILDNNNKNQKIDLFEKEKYTLIELVKNIAKKNNKKIILIPINYKLIFYILRSLEILNFKLNIKSDSLKSLL